MAITINGSTGITTDIDGNESLTLNRDTSDGDIITLQKDNTTVGSIGNDGSNLYIERNANSGLLFGSYQILPRRNGSLINNTVSLGNTSYTFADGYFGGGVYVGGTGSANHLDDYEEGTWTPAIYDASSVSHSVQDGAYIKIGKLVYITCRLQWGSLSGNANEVSGLPFTALSQPKEAMSSNVYVNSGFTMASGKYWINFYTMANQTRLYFTQQPNTQDINFNSSGNIYFQTMYITS